MEAAKHNEQDLEKLLQTGESNQGSKTPEV